MTNQQLQQIAARIVGELSPHALEHVEFFGHLEELSPSIPDRYLLHMALRESSVYGGLKWAFTPEERYTIESAIVNLVKEQAK